MTKRNNTPFLEVSSIACLKQAWKKIYDNGMRSKSSETRHKVIEFRKNDDIHLRRIQRLLRKKQFEFKGNKGIFKKRPIVLAPIENRIVQRSLLNVIQLKPDLQKYLDMPTSFGGIRSKKEKDIYKGVPAAVKAVETAIKNGTVYYYKSDVKSFFTQIPRPVVINTIKSYIEDPHFVELLNKATNLEIENLNQLGNKKQYFIFDEIGVPQGCCLSPLLGNILLYEFDNEMNKNGVVCLRYLDDFIIFGLTKRAVHEAFRKALKLLRKHNLTAYQVLGNKQNDKARVGKIRSGFEFLGVEINDKFIKPSQEARNELIRKIDNILNVEINGHIEGGFSLRDILQRIHYKIRAWGEHYDFCDDDSVFGCIDEEIDKKLKNYISRYNRIVKKFNWRDARRCLGVYLLLDHKK